MRVMVIIKGNEESEAGIMPSEKLLNAMGKFNEELVDAGVMLAVWLGRVWRTTSFHRAGARCVSC